MSEPAPFFMRKGLPDFKFVHPIEHDEPPIIIGEHECLNCGASQDNCYCK